MLGSQILVCDSEGQEVELQGLLVLLQVLVLHTGVVVARCYDLHKGFEFDGLQLVTAYLLVLNESQKQRLQ